MNVLERKSRLAVVALCFINCCALLAGQQVVTYQPFNKKTAVFALLEKFSDQKIASILDANETQELALSDTVSKIDNTRTSFGTWALSRGLIPTGNLENITANQERLNTLISNAHCFSQFEAALNAIDCNEDSLINYYKENCQLHTDIKKLYFSSLFSALNTNRWALEGAFAVDIGKILLKFGFELGVTTVINEFLSDASIDDTEKLTKLRDAISLVDENACIPRKQLWSMLTPDNFSIMKSFKRGISGPVTTHQKLWQNLVNPDRNLLSLFKTSLQALGTDAMLAYSMYTSYNYLKFAWNKPNELAQELKKIAHVMTAAQCMVLAAQNSNLQQWPAIITLSKLSRPDASISQSLQQLLKLLKEIEDSNSVMYSRGSILLAHQLLLDTKVELIPYLQALAEVDAFMSMAQLFKEQTIDKPWCFAEFTTDTTPFISAHDFWLPLVSTEEIVLNSLDFAKENAPSKIVLTGPNGGGKSTIMKGLAYQIVFAQSFGIVPARNCKVRLFTGLFTALNPKEDITKGLSTFMAQKVRMNQLFTRIATCASNDCYFMLVDEPYHGTVEATAQKMVYDFGASIANKKQLLFMMATHFELPTKLEQEYPGSFANYQCEFTQSPQGKLERTYRLLRGAAHWWFHDDAMRSLYLHCLEESGAYLG